MTNFGDDIFVLMLSYYYYYYYYYYFGIECEDDMFVLMTNYDVIPPLSELQFCGMTFCWDHKFLGIKNGIVKTN